MFCVHSILCVFSIVFAFYWLVLCILLQVWLRLTLSPGKKLKAAKLAQIVFLQPGYCASVVACNWLNLNLPGAINCTSGASKGDSAARAERRSRLNATKLGKVWCRVGSNGEWQNDRSAACPGAIAACALGCLAARQAHALAGCFQYRADMWLATRLALAATTAATGRDASCHKHFAAEVSRPPPGCQMP
jgi:hypothetical protein